MQEPQADFAFGAVVRSHIEAVLGDLSLDVRVYEPL
jgi:hypothetical protein